MNGYEPRWDLDLPFGEGGETYVGQLLRWLIDADERIRVEVKRKRYNDDSFYVEQEQLPRGAITYRPSGINVSEAEFWAFVIDQTGVIVIIPAELLRSAIRADVGRPKEESDGDNPTKGRLMRLVCILNHEHILTEGRTA